jgi:FAD/FMN-containing dehydrogenase
MIPKEKLETIVGSGNVLQEPAVLNEYARDMSFVNRVRPACVVKPTKADEVQEIIKLANTTKTALVPVSSGPPHFRGDTVPTIGGAVMVDLSQMNKVVFVDRPRRVCMVEAGVTFEDLIPAVTKEGLRLNMPLLPRKTKSVVGSVLEREPVVMPKYQWDVSDPLACAGLYFGNGDEFRTGQAAGPGTVEEQWKVGGVQKAPYGPGIGSWHRLMQGAQGTMGIVTWMSLRCELLPSIEEPFVVGCDNLNTLLEMSHWLIRLKMVNECFILNNVNLAAIFADQSSEDFLKFKVNLPPWTLFYNVAGQEVLPEKRVAAHLKDITALTQRLYVQPEKSVGGISANAIMNAVQQPSADPYWKLRFKGACEDIFFLSIHDKLEGQIECMKQEAEKAMYPASTLGVYIQPMVQGTSYHCEFNLFFDASDTTERKRLKTLTTTATKKLMNKGAFFSRPYGEDAGIIINRDGTSANVMKKIKAIFDPNGVMNPGKVGL